MVAVLISLLPIMVTSPPLPLPSEKEKIVPTSILPAPIISTLPPSPVLEEDANSPSIVLTAPV